MSNPPGPLVPPLEGDDAYDDDAYDGEIDRDPREDTELDVDGDDDERPFDPDLDDRLIDSAAADEQAAREGTMDDDGDG